MTTLGVVLVGGRSTRMGRPKADLKVGDRTLVEHVVDSLRAHVDAVALGGAWGAPQHPQHETLKLAAEIQDVWPDAGPVGALVSAILWARDHQYDHVALTSCDWWEFRGEWFERLPDGVHSAFFGGDDARWHPMVSKWHVASFPFDAPPTQPDRPDRVMGLWRLLDHVDATKVEPPNDFRRAFSINTPEDLRRAESLAARAAHRSTTSVTITRWRAGAWTEAPDVVSVEEPLEIRLGYDGVGGRKQQSVSITMRTPGDDFSLAAGFLFSENILRHSADVAEIVWCNEGKNPNVVRVELAVGVKPDLLKLQRHVYTTSSCGVCGKTSLEALSMQGFAPVTREVVVTPEVLCGLPAALRAAQADFDQTGGLHAVGEFGVDGTLWGLAEDVGRHNAMDKLIGRHVRAGRSQWQGDVLMLSGRASFELLQKAVSLGAPIVAAVGAPSSLAIELAAQFGVTLVGFLRGGAFNVYTHAHRVARQANS